MSKSQTDKAFALFVKGSGLEDRGLIAQAVRTYRRGANLGDCSAQICLANLLDDKVRPRRPEEAVYWYKRAVRAGSTIAAYNMAMHHRNLGNVRWQRHWLKVALRMGDPDAKAELRKLNASAK